MMKIDVKTIYDGDYYSDYNPMIHAFGNVVIQVDDNGYEGDTRVLYDENGKIGFLIVGWGSCPGCDALQGCDSIDEVQELCDSLQNDIRWFDDKKQALSWFKTNDFTIDYYYHTDRWNDFYTKCIEYLS